MTIMQVTNKIARLRNYFNADYTLQIAEAAKRPDITIYSERTKTVIIIELTVPMEENLSNA